jgi:hypothetical protein
MDGVVPEQVALSLGQRRGVGQRGLGAVCAAPDIKGGREGTRFILRSLSLCIFSGDQDRYIQKRCKLEGTTNVFRNIGLGTPSERNTAIETELPLKTSRPPSSRIFPRFSQRIPSSVSSGVFRGLSGIIRYRNSPV